MADEDVEFVIEAVKMVAEHAWKLLPQVQSDLYIKCLFNWQT